MLAVAAVLALALVTGEARAASPGDAGRGRELYAERCVLCHGGHGQGWDWSQKVAQPPVPVPDLAQVTPQRSDAYLFAIVKDGGEAVERTRFMPPFGFQLSDEEVWDLVAYMRALSRAGPPR
ncbi:MAG: c-type cytochrome [Candidatus Rokuibacteriota bacterium]